MRFKHRSGSFIKLWPEETKLIGWYNRLVKHGHHTAHIHPGGWLSGVVYLKTIDSIDKEEVAIEFGLHGYNLPIIYEDPPRKLYKPKRGDIVLFRHLYFTEQSLLHEETERCVVAFDVKKK